MQTVARSDRKISRLAIASLVVGILGFVLVASVLPAMMAVRLPGICRGFALIGAVGVIPAVTCGHMARSHIKRSEGVLTGRGTALSGLTLGYVSIVATAVTGILPLRARLVYEERACGHNIEQIDAARDAAARDDSYYAVPDEQERRILKHLPGSRLPLCPGGGQYKVDPVGHGTRCSKHGNEATCSMGL